MPTGDKLEQERKALELVREAIKHDEELRAKYEVGTKFRFVQDRLHTLAAQLEADLQQVTNVIQEKVSRAAGADEKHVYVYLYNAHGINLRTWQSLLLPKLFYEFSVNRPLYADKAHIISFLRSRASQVQHGFLTVVVKASDIIQPISKAPADVTGNPLIKVKEGTIRFENLISFTHNGHEYSVNEQGELIKKD